MSVKCFMYKKRIFVFASMSGVATYFYLKYFAVAINEISIRMYLDIIELYYISSVDMDVIMI